MRVYFGKTSEDVYPWEVIQYDEELCPVPYPTLSKAAETVIGVGVYVVFIVGFLVRRQFVYEHGQFTEVPFEHNDETRHLEAEHMAQSATDA